MMNVWQQQSYKELDWTEQAGVYKELCSRFAWQTIAFYLLCLFTF